MMEKISTILTLIRWPNILIIFLLQYVFIHTAIWPSLDAAQIGREISNFNLLLLASTTCIVTIGGYIINDIYDLKTDAINKPQKNIIGKKISIYNANASYLTLGLVGLILTIFLGFTTQNINLIYLYPLTWASLFLYSSKFKKTPLIGNIIVAFFSSGVGLLIYLAEKKALQKLQIIDYQSYEEIYYLTFIYTYYSFFSSLFREIVKDLEDIKGDTAFRQKTLPVLYGTNISHNILYLIWLLLFIPTLYLIYLNSINHQHISSIYLITTIFGPLIIILLCLNQAKEKKDYAYISKITKILMLTGIALIFFL